MKLTDLEPCTIGRKDSPNAGLAFNCPGPCCADRRELQSKAAALEAAGDPGASAARMRAFENQPFRVFVGWRAGHGYEQVYTRTGDAFDVIGGTSIAEEIDRSAAGHARLRITGGKVTVL